MTEAEEAYRLAEQRIAEAAAGGHRFLNLSGDIDEHAFGDEKRAGDERFRRLDRLPPGTAGLTGLRRLDLDRTKVADIASLAGLTALQSLGLGGTPVAGIAPLAGLTALRTLGLGGSRIADVSPLAGLESLRPLSFSDTPVCEAEPELRALSEIEDDGERTRRTLEWLRKRAAETELLAPRPQGPQFAAPENAPVRLVQPAMAADDPEQARLHEDCRIKSEVLAQVAPMGGNAQPMLAGALARYRAARVDTCEERRKMGRVDRCRA